MSHPGAIGDVLRTPWRRVMGPRDPGQEHRASTPLELLFDLCFVVAISRAAAELAHGVEENHALAALGGYLIVFFAIWWAWMNFTWFASSYDTDDVPYRLLTFLQMAGVLVLAAGVPAAMNEFRLGTVVAGYVIMRVAMILQWLRAAAEHPEGRPTTLRYAGGLAVLQVLWLASLALPRPIVVIAAVVLILGEIAVPAWAESRGGRPTTWHPEHIAERYGLFTIITLGEVILGTTAAISSGIGESGLTVELGMVAFGGLVLVAGLWWIYFLGGDYGSLGSLRTALFWGYGHYFVFGAVGALGGGIEAAVVISEHHAAAGPVLGALGVAVPVVVFLLVLTALRRVSWGSGTLNYWFAAATVVLVLVCALLAGTLGLGVSVLLMAVLVALLQTVYLVRASRRVRTPVPDVA